MNKHIEAMALLHGHLELFSEECLKVKPKSGQRLIPFEFNAAQRFIHAKIEEQRQKTGGMVRAIILKGRQQGVSTYTAARFYHRTAMNRNIATFIVAHEAAATSNLFGLVKRYHDNNPLAPATGATNARELVFSRLGSEYKLATAGTKDVGRSATVQLCHASEFAFWDNAELHIAGLGQTIADEPGTEVIIESTANGQGNTYHEYWQKAESGENGYIPIFVPWTWQPEYTDAVTPDFQPTSEEAKLMDVYKLTPGQVLWRRRKIAGFGRGREWLFRQEYPLFPAEAFVTATEDPFISPDDVMAAVNSSYMDKAGPLVIGVDPAEMGGDRTVICFRRGRVAPRFEKYTKRTTMEIAGIVAKTIKERDPDAVFIDKIGIGAGIVDRLKELGFDRVFGVNSGMTATDNVTYANKRAEMWGRIREWLMDGPVRLPNEPELISDLCAPKYRYDSKGRYLIEKKEDMKARKVRSPDYADALGLTFSEMVQGRGLDRNDIAIHDDYAGPASSAGY